VALTFSGSPVHSLPWRELAGFRDVLIHQYGGVSVTEIWRIVEKNLEPLPKSIEAMLPPLDELERQVADDEETTEG
jgi:uncharacterized protein with HEPN domain